MTQEVKPFIFRVSRSDYLALLGILVPVVSLIMYT